MVTAAELVCVYGTLLGIGLLGERVRDAGRGAFRASSTLIAPATTAFSIWTVIYVGLLLVAIWYWLPGDRSAQRLTSVAGLVAASMLLNAAWILMAQTGWVWASVAVIAALLVVLAVLVTRLSRQPWTTRTEAFIVDGTFGIYLGWVCVATCANVAAALVDSGVPATGTTATASALVVLALVLAVAWKLAVALPGQLGVPIGMIWGLVWIAYARSHQTPDSMTVALAAAVVGAGVAGIFAHVTAERRSARASATERPRS